jgi:UDP-2,3-diacylglucosamine pyrophosphatase LpxH
MPHKLRKHYRAVFISDLHLGFRGAKPQNLLSFLKSIECDTLFIVGDGFDLWAMNGWNLDCTGVVRRILKMMKHGTKVIYLPGNHDESIRHYLPLAFGEELVLADEYVYTTLCGLNLLVIHGDIFDFVSKWLSHVGAHIYDFLIFCNHWVHKLRMLLRMKTYWSLSAYLKRKTKKALSAIRNFEDAVARYAEKKNCAGVVCGHIHTASMTHRDGMLYVNCGDWVESLTAFVEHDDGKLEIIHWHDMTKTGVEDFVQPAVLSGAGSEVETLPTGQIV